MSFSTNFQKNILDELSEIEKYNKWLVSKFDKYIGKSVLEIGSGTGNITKLLRKPKRIVFPTEISKEFLKILNSHFNNSANFLDISSKQSVNALQRKLKMSGSFDTVIAINVLEHIQDDQLALNNIFKVLDTRGRLILLVPAHQFLYGSYDYLLGHYRRYAKSDLIKALENQGFEVVKIVYVNKIGALGWLTNARVFKRKSFSKWQLKIIDYIVPVLDLLDRIIIGNFGLSVVCIAKKK